MRVTKRFYLGEYHVTVGQFRKFVEQSKFDAGTDEKGRSWQNAFPGQTDDHPVVCVNWNGAKAFCDWLSKKEGKEYRLPTEAEWEYACRAGTQTKWNFGDDESQLDESMRGMSTELRDKALIPVGQKRPNAWGLYDTHGNAWEWCADWYAWDYYVSSPPDDPKGPSSGTSRVLRGGDCGCRCGPRAFRHTCHERPGQIRDRTVGFRVARAP